MLRQITDELMFEIGELCGYEYVDTYATKKWPRTSRADDPARIRSIADRSTTTASAAAAEAPVEAAV